MPKIVSFAERAGRHTLAIECGHDTGLLLGVVRVFADSDLSCDCLRFLRRGAGALIVAEIEEPPEIDMETIRDRIAQVAGVDTCVLISGRGQGG